MTTQRQIEANRRNAGKSTGPRSRGGKQRARSNAYQHGLTTSRVFSAAVAKQAEKLMREIAGKTKNPLVLHHAREAAYAEIELSRVRRVKVALIEQAAALGRVESLPLTKSLREATRYLHAILPDSAATMPSQEPERTAEAIRRAWPGIQKLDRYESRAAARRDRAVREISKMRYGGKYRT
jgi:hypothetical protein